MSPYARIRFARREAGAGDDDLLPGDLVEEVYSLPAKGQRFWRGRPHRVLRVERGDPATIVLVPDADAVYSLSRRLPPGYQLEVQRDIETGEWSATIYLRGVWLCRQQHPSDADAAVEEVLREAGL